MTAVGTTIGYLGLGSNVGDRRANLQEPSTRSRPSGVGCSASSSVYDTDPVGGGARPAELPQRLRAGADRAGRAGAARRGKAIERELGRAAGGVRHGPRAIDIDVLLLGEQTLRHERLSLPHEQVLTRRFVLIPALELDADLAVPDGRGWPTRSRRCP